MTLAQCFYGGNEWRTAVSRHLCSRFSAGSSKAHRDRVIYAIALQGEGIPVAPECDPTPLALTKAKQMGQLIPHAWETGPRPAALPYGDAHDRGQAPPPTAARAEGLSRHPHRAPDTGYGTSPRCRPHPNTPV